MTPQKWSKAPPAHITAFDAALPDHPKVERRTMFGYACAFVNGNMFTGLHEHNICVRLGSDEASARIEGGEAQKFAPMAGRIMKDYVALPLGDINDPIELKKWLEDALRYSLTLTPKPKKITSVPTPVAPKSKKKAKKSDA